MRRVPLPARARWRLLILQGVVLVLLATLFVRLYEVQVAAGGTYAQQASANLTREVLTPAVRGAIVDAAGRTLVGNRLSMQITVDRSKLAKLTAVQRSSMLTRLAKVLGMSSADLTARTKLCGDPGAQKPPVCWNGSPYQPIPVATDVSSAVAVQVMEHRESFPGVSATSVLQRSYPDPFGANAAHVLGYLSPITTGELDKIAAGGGDDVAHRQDVVGRSGLEQSYNTVLAGTPGVERVTVDNLGRATGVAGRTAAVSGRTVQTSIDARLQALVEKQLAGAIGTARKTRDPVTHKNYVADSGAAIVLDNHTGHVLAMASYPTYDPSVWVGGISQKELDALYSPAADIPLLSRATQAQLAPGSTFKPITTTAALNHGFSTKTRLDCSSSYQVGARTFKNYESESFGPISFAKALAVSCDTFFYRVGYQLWQKAGGNHAAGDVHAADPVNSTAKQFGLGRPTGIDLPGEAGGRVADRTWKHAYYDAMKAYYCKVAAGNTTSRDFLHRFAREFCVDGYRYRAGDAVNTAIGQGDTLLTPIQEAVYFAALGNGGTLWRPSLVEATISADGKRTAVAPKANGRLPATAAQLSYMDGALADTIRSGTAAWKFGGFPLDKVTLHGKTGTAEREGKQTTGWLSTFDSNYTVVMMVSQGGTGSGVAGVAERNIWSALYGITGQNVDLKKSVLSGSHVRAPR